MYFSQETSGILFWLFFPSHDFVHTFDFHHVSQVNGEGSPVIFAVKDERGNYIACWPALKREIAGTIFTDLTSVYGYGGPLIERPDLTNVCLSLIYQGMQDLGVVSLFSRMHPLFVEQIQEPELRGIKCGNVVVIDAARQTPLVSYRSGHKYEIRKALTSGVQVHVDEQCDAIEDFIEIYQQSMRDLSAANYYLFAKSYFYEIKNAKDFKTILVYAELDGKKIAASMFIVTGHIMQYFLSGTVEAYKNLSPSKLIIYKAHEIAISMGIEKIVLGGGVGSKEDHLFKFKTGFSDQILPFYILKKIINSEVYKELCVAKGIVHDASGYFPSYRTLH